MKKILFMLILSAFFLTACVQVKDNGALPDSSSEMQTNQAIDKHITGPVNDYSEANTDNSPVDDLGGIYFKEPTANDIVFDEETGIKYVKNQLLISVLPDTQKQLVEDIVKEIDAEIVGMIELTGDYQIEFTGDKTIDELEEIADYILQYQFVLNVTLNMIIEKVPAATGQTE